MTLHPALVTAIGSLVVALLMVAVGYGIRGLVATGKLTEQISNLTTQLQATAVAVDNLKKDMLTPLHLENSVLKLKLELLRESPGKGTREADKT